MITTQHGQQTDEQLMLAYQAGQQKAFDELYQRYRQPIFAYLMRNIGSQMQAEEVYQEVWLSLIKQRTRYTATSSFRSYLFCIAHSRLMDFYRQQGKLSANDSIDEGELELVACALQQPDSQLEQQRLIARLQWCISQIPEEQRAVLVLKLESELSLQSIAEQLNIAFETLKSRFRYAQAKLQRCLGGGES
ncbi:MAG: sigma-70 family RNA polymerase sigma factor [Pseudomonadales bacterium]|nr:sigma-70 family RNA polymerase sigma factor [Pseudomonadales bacterium]